MMRPRTFPSRNPRWTRTALRVALTICGCLCAGGAWAEWTTLRDNGRSSNRVDVVILGDGYTQSDLDAGAFDLHVQGFLDYLFSETPNTEPFGRYRNYFNVHTVRVASPESGADIPGENLFKNTALDATYLSDGETERLLSVDDAKADAVRDAALAGAPFTAEMQFLTVNETRYGGSGGAYAVFAGGNSQSSEIALHEVAHSFCNLADEYDVPRDTYVGQEPSERNVTTDPTGAKWSHWIGYDQPGIGLIGAYEGAMQYQEGLYRPSLDSKMRSLNRPFDAVSREQLVLAIYDLVDPLDAWSYNATTLVNPRSLAVAPIDDELIEVEWRLDGELVPDASANALNVAALDLTPGNHVLSARAYDPTGFDFTSGWVREGSAALEQIVDWQVFITSDDFLPGDYDGDRQVAAADYSLWRSHFGDRVAPFTLADGNGDGIVDLADYSVWRDHLGQAQPDTASTLVVPEPATLVLLMPWAGAIIWCGPPKRFILADLRS